MMVMMMAITPSLNASSLVVVMLDGLFSCQLSAVRFQVSQLEQMPHNNVIRSLMLVF
jgi:hypothetical protein